MNILPITTSYVTRTINTAKGLVVATFAIHRCGANCRFELVSAVPVNTNPQGDKTQSSSTAPIISLPGKTVVVSHFVIASPFIAAIPHRSFAFLSVQKTRAPSRA